MKLLRVSGDNDTLAARSILETGVLSAATVGDACVSSAVVAAGRSSDFGLPTKRRFPFPAEQCVATGLTLFVPITAASQRRNLTGFPFNKTEVLHLHLFNLSDRRPRKRMFQPPLQHLERRIEAGDLTHPLRILLVGLLQESGRSARRRRSARHDAAPDAEWSRECAAWA